MAIVAEYSDLQGEQAVWRATHSIGAGQGLDAAGLHKLRQWAFDRMTYFAWSVFEPGSIAMRTTFPAAITHAAIAVSEGRVPE